MGHLLFYVVCLAPLVDLVQFQAADQVQQVCHRKAWKALSVDQVQRVKLDQVHNEI